jgi:flagellar basal-body rod modification protein FlgD
MQITEQQKAALSQFEALRSSGVSKTASADDDSSTGSSSSSSGSSEATITANDFLTLLVSEMKNQDPTSDTDPNEYIDQLVQVNSLQQLIQINTDLGGSSSSSSSGTSSDAAKSDAVNSVSGASGTAQAGTAHTGSVIKGNTSATDSGLDAGRVASAMGRKTGNHTDSWAGSSHPELAAAATAPTGAQSGESASAAAEGTVKQGRAALWRSVPVHSMQR